MVVKSSSPSYPCFASKPRTSRQSHLSHSARVRCYLHRSLDRRRSFIPGAGGLASILALSGSSAHRALTELSGSLSACRLMAFSVGLTGFVVSSHPKIAKQILNSSAFADRAIKESARELLFYRAMGFAPYGKYWK